MKGKEQHNGGFVPGSISRPLSSRLVWVIRPTGVPRDGNELCSPSHSVPTLSRAEDPCHSCSAALLPFSITLASLCMMVGILASSKSPEVLPSNAFCVSASMRKRLENVTFHEPAPVRPCWGRHVIGPSGLHPSSVTAFFFLSVSGTGAPQTRRANDNTVLDAHHQHPALLRGHWTDFTSLPGHCHLCLTAESRLNGRAAGGPLFSWMRAEYDPLYREH